MENLLPFGKFILLPSLNTATVSTSYAGIELTYLCPLFGEEPARQGMSHRTQRQ